MCGKGRTGNRDWVIADLGLRQHGVVSTKQLVANGLTQRQVEYAASAGRLHRIHRGVYAVGHANLTWHGRCMAAVLASEPAVASHLSAGWLWGLLRNRPGALHVTAPSRRHAKAPYVVHYAALADEDRDCLEGIPVTSLARTLLDLAAILSTHRLDRVLERAEELRLLDLGPLRRLLARVGGHPGAGRLRRALVLYREEPAVVRSNFERDFLNALRAADIHTPSMNFAIAGFELDAYWPEHRFAVELDVYATHGGRAAFERDRRRQEELKLTGIEMVRITDTRFRREPAAVIGRLAALLERRRRELGRGLAA